MEVFTKITQATHCSSIKYMLSNDVVLQHARNTSTTNIQRQKKRVTTIKYYTFKPIYIPIFRCINSYLCKNNLTTY